MAMSERAARLTAILTRLDRAIPQVSLHVEEDTEPAEYYFRAAIIGPRIWRPHVLPGRAMPAPDPARIRDWQVEPIAVCNADNPSTPAVLDFLRHVRSDITWMVEHLTAAPDAGERP
jgi:hypothetical protein